MNKLKKNFLAECQEDECGLWFLVTLIKDECEKAPLDEIKQVALLIIKDLVRSKSIKAIDINYDSLKFNEWDLSNDETIKKISQEWEKKWKDMEGFDDIVWFVSA